MIIRTTAKSVYYPMAGQRAEVIRGSGRFRYVRSSLLVNAKNLKNWTQMRALSGSFATWP